MSGNYITVVIDAIQDETPGVKTFVISRADGGALDYDAGRFLTFAFFHHGREERRSYSISSSPALPGPLAFTVKRVENGAYSRLLVDRARVGDKLNLTGISGLFTLPADLAQWPQVFFFAAGIGITPILSQIKTILYTSPETKIVLVYSNRSNEDVVFYNELQSLAEQFKSRFALELLYSTSFDLSRARLNKSLLPQLLSEYALFPVDKLLFYVCGPFSYMRMVLLTLEELGIAAGQVKKENFNTNDRQVRKPEPPDTATHTAFISVGGKEWPVPVVYPDSILAAARRVGLSLPYSCEVGRCGSCVAQCTGGAVWLSYNEVLTARDIDGGKVLTCVGHPVGGDIVISV